MLDDAAKREIVSRMQVITGLDNPGFVLQIKTWLKENDVDIEGTIDERVLAALRRKGPDTGSTVRVREGGF